MQRVNGAAHLSGSSRRRWHRRKSNGAAPTDSRRSHDVCALITPIGGELKVASRRLNLTRQKLRAPVVAVFARFAAGGGAAVAAAPVRL